MATRHDPEGLQLPIKLDSTSNGEFVPVPLEKVHHRARQLALEQATKNARRSGKGRRDFLISLCGAATTLLAFNRSFASVGKTGGLYQLPAEAAVDEAAAAAALAKRELIFDVQGHFVNPTGAWTRGLPDGARPLSFTQTAGCAAASLPGNLDHLQCLGPDAFIRHIFLDSDTDLAVLSFVPSTRAAEPLTIEEAAATAAIVEQMAGSHRLLLHGRVNPNQDGDLDGMDELAEKHPISAWKTYTQWGPDGRGFFLDDEVGLAMLEKARQLGIRNVAIHKGIPFGPQSYEHSTCVDVGRVAKRFPDINFLIYHSGYVIGRPEGAYDPQRSDGIDQLISSLKAAGLGPGCNVYAELGSTWRFLMRDPDSAAHAIGKLLKHMGPDNILWGTDSIWYGSPQDQIQAMRSFAISTEFQERFEYPALSDVVRSKIFAANALKIYGLESSEVSEQLRSDAVGISKHNYLNRPDPKFVTYGPRTRREYLRLKAWGG